ncbi:hypothetical protein GMA5_8 [Gordonia phage GMA5]|uniref:Uncharacterized protein n=1 Tax=Gordonia phage GMA5 TaxID=1647472 RepID=A0A0K0MWM6_9CAUD|nr:hypothetical protein BH786_gp08 [Gordonia phage GMA5]AKI28622.1 hypothetical protein GMA5_8 [Gordonia phage GMA5]
MASTLALALDRVVEALTEVGIAATTDPRDLQIPGAWVTVHDVIDPTLCGSFTVRADVCLIAADNGMPFEVEALGTLLDLVADAVTFDEPVRPMTVTPPGLAPLPALVITTTTE